MVPSHGIPSQPEAPRLLKQVREAIVSRHYRLRTEHTYVGWIKRFILLHDKQHPRDLGGQEVQQFLSHLAVAGHVAASIQSQALSAVLFLYQQVSSKTLVGWTMWCARSSRSVFRGVNPGRESKRSWRTSRVPPGSWPCCCMGRSASPGCLPAGERC